MASTSTLLDANVLVYAFYQDARHHEASRSLVERAASGDASFVVVQQVLSDLVAVVTDPRRVTEPKTVPDALEAVDQLLSQPGVSLLPTPPDLTARWLELLAEYPVRRQQVFDAQLAATMLGCRVLRICTYNTKHFTGLRGIVAVAPDEM